MSDNVTVFPGTRIEFTPDYGTDDTAFYDDDDGYITLPRRTPTQRATRQVYIGVGVAILTSALSGLVALATDVALTPEQLALGIAALLLNAALLGLRKYAAATRDEA